MESGAGVFFYDFFLLDYKFWRGRAAAAEDFDFSTGRAAKIFRIALMSQPVGWQPWNFGRKYALAGARFGKEFWLRSLEQSHIEK